MCRCFHIYFVWCRCLVSQLWVPLGPDIPGIILILLLYDVSCIPDIYYLYIQNAAAAAAAALCVAILLLLLQQLLLFVIVCRMAKNVAGLLNLNLWFHPVFSFSSVLSHLRPRFAYTTSSIIMGMRERGEALPVIRVRISYILGRNYGYSRSQGGRLPAVATPPLYYYFI